MNDSFLQEISCYFQRLLYIFCLPVFMFRSSHHSHKRLVKLVSSKAVLKVLPCGGLVLFLFGILALTISVGQILLKFLVQKYMMKQISVFRCVHASL